MSDRADREVSSIVDAARAAGLRSCGRCPERDRLRRDPHALDGMSPQEALSYKSRAKNRFKAARLALGWSHYDVAGFLLGDRDKESTPRGWENTNDFVRWPPDDAVEKLEAEAAAKTLHAFAAGGLR